jgi:hypothetical protein
MNSRLIRLVFVLSCWVPGVAFAQTAASKPPDAPIASLRTPTSPAFTLLGIEPSAIERPATPADLAVNFASRVQDFQALPKDFAIELSPYWLVPRARLTWRSDVKRSLGVSLARTLSVSMATAQDPDDNSAQLGLGARAALWSGKLSEDSVAALEEEEKRLSADSKEYLEIYNKLMAGVPVPTPGDEASLTRFKEAQLDAARRVDLLRVEQRGEAIRESTDLVLTREGFFMDLAAAVSWHFPDQSWETNELAKVGVWVTPSYESGAQTWLGVFRYVHDANSTIEEHVVEWGARNMYSNDTFAISAEFLQRIVKGGEKTYRIAGVIEQRLIKSTWIVATFGQDRAHDGIAQGLLAQIGVSLNLAKERYSFGK